MEEGEAALKSKTPRFREGSSLLNCLLRPRLGLEAYFFFAAFFVAFLAAFLTAFLTAFLAAFLVAFIIDSFSLTSKFAIPYEIAACFIYKVSELQCQEKNHA